MSQGAGNFPGVEDIILLTDGGSASASEILAGALRDHDAALLVGTNTFGKGSVQELVEISPETSLKVTIAKWILPAGEHISIDGIEPDVQVVDVSETEDFDEQLNKAVELINRDDFSSLIQFVPEELRENESE